MRNVDELRDDLDKALTLIQADPSKCAQVKEIANVAGKIISTAKVELLYAAMRKERPEIPFLHYTKASNLPGNVAINVPIKTLPKKP